ncbi:hypothetical protein ASPVEDRAFT_130131 [Aspergillus versicolor CBS 583.65]|uniref:Pyrroline-5-carboxylate reductase n=1 Tax=Aspergillus versicolor CBS 583.65 TaxID=1036611 RepID=A0A1L9PJJ1_ASPVE|nr:uncharacterized protein ASPVEDRAFT_130131 [Aspergillus versicolor CBS 583.65]OJJ01694.1 hypothetical protein ASPVEDRAFT_130131 [Aspergillus versicolor CBS 583.65]
MGRALLGALLPSTTKSESPVSEITVAVSRPESQEELQHQFHDTPGAAVHFVHAQNVETVQQADAVLLAFPPEETKTILSSPGMKEAAQGKVIISMLARIPRAEISRLLENPHDGTGISDTECVQIVRAMPSIGTAAHESATFIASVGPAQDKAMDLTRWIFSSVGKVFYVSDEHFDTITGMCAFSNALITTSIQAIAQSTSAEGVPVEQALAVSAQCIRGSLALILSGTSPEQLQTSLSAPGSITGQAIQALQDSRLTAFLDPVLRAAIDRAREDATNSD